MTVGSLVGGLLVLLALLLIAGMLGAVGSIEFTIWLALVVSWTAWWLATRRNRNTTP